VRVLNDNTLVTASRAIDAYAERAVLYRDADDVAPYVIQSVRLPMWVAMAIVLFLLVRFGDVPADM